MKYYSTRNQMNYLTAAQVIKEGIAPDGGLYVPSEKLPVLPMDKLSGISYVEMAKLIFNIFLTDYDELEISNAIVSAYDQNSFDHPEVTPLHKLTSDSFILELWHGPTSAFKDIALQVLPYLLRTAIKITREKAELVILTATSGDTGKSALEGFKDIPGMKIVVYFPAHGVSEVQKLQMITQEGSNLSVAAVEGDFDDAQNGVKEIFGNQELVNKLRAEGYRLSSANSINWGRLLPQIVYYFYAYGKLVNINEISSGEKVNFAVPTGNFGNILAGYYARKLGLPINRLICAANINNVLTDFINSGTYNRIRKLQPSISPSMDILVSSNLERLLFEITGHDSGKVISWMKSLVKDGQYKTDNQTQSFIRDIFWSDFADDHETKQMIATVYKQHNYLIDTHTAVGSCVLNKYRETEKDQTKTVILSTASPYKFTGSVASALFGEEAYKNSSELELLEILSKKTGTPIPANLTGLDNKIIRHKQVIERDAMHNHLLEFLKFT